MLFTPNFMRTLINQLGNQDRLLHRAAVKATQTIQDVVKEATSSRFRLGDTAYRQERPPEL